jgi:Domain of unknown function (DUF5060)/Putative collagen-binding domain of a collagenase
MSRVFHRARFVNFRSGILILALLVGFMPRLTDALTVVQGDLMKWHKVTLLYQSADSYSEKGTPNPFLDARMDVEFTNAAGKAYLVPGYFGADGDAGMTSAEQGRIWVTHFSPNATGDWKYKVSFYKGSNVSIAESPGTPVATDTGTFKIEVSDKKGRDHRAKGRLEYVGEHYPRFAETGEYFLKGGTDSPENLLAYKEFDGTSPKKDFADHIADWSVGDITWNENRGKGIIGALNYLSKKGLNTFSFLTYNVGGDGDDVWPMISKNKADRIRYDVSKLEQWEYVFSHADKMGLFLHFKMQETENDDSDGKSPDAALDGGNLGPERKVYYRELIARFAHHLALNWNFGEENTQSTEQRKAGVKFIAGLDSYHHLIVLHTGIGGQTFAYTPLLGNASELTGASLQVAADKAPAEIKKWRDESAKAGKKWVISFDEQVPSGDGLRPDDNNNRDEMRKEALWPGIMAGMVGVEWYFGYAFPNSDLNANTFKTRSLGWDMTNNALKFFTQNTPWGKMNPDNSFTSSGVGMSSADKNVFVVYLKNGGATNINLAAAQGKYIVRWYNPSTGTFEGANKVVDGGALIASGPAPSSPTLDWAILVNKEGFSSIRETVKAGSIPVNFVLTDKSLLISSNNIKELTLYNMEGAEIFRSTINGQSEVPMKIKQGLYLMHAVDFKNQRYLQKLLVK